MATASVTNNFVASTTIVSDDVDTNFADLITFLNNSVVHVDGAKAMSGALAMGTNKITGLGAASSNGDALRWEQFNGHAHTGSTISALDAADTTTGAFHVDRIPSLNASKITAGTFSSSDRIPNLPASKTTSGTFDSARIPNLAASKITSGTLGDARIPNLNASKVTAGAFSSARIPSTITQSMTFSAAVGIAGTFNANSTVDFSGLPAGSGTTLVISSSSVKELSSTKRVKKLLGTIDKVAMKAALALLPVYLFVYHGEENEQLGWIAEDVAEVDPRLVNYDKQGLPVSINQLAIQAVLA